jgi:hypothetical protein
MTREEQDAIRHEIDLIIRSLQMIRTDIHIMSIQELIKRIEIRLEVLKARIM